MKNEIDPLAPASALPGRAADVEPAFAPSAPDNLEKADHHATAAAHRYYWGKIAPRYDGVINTMIGAEARGKVLARFGSGALLGDAIEIGCGTGYHTDTLAAKSTRLVATDLSPGMLAIARNRVRATNVTFRAADCRRLPFDPATFDTAVLGLVLHFADPALALTEVWRVVRPGGSIFIVNPGLLSMTPLFRFGCRCRMIFHGITRYRLKPPRDFSNFLLSGGDVCKLLELNGWTDSRLERIPISSGAFGLPLELVRAVKPHALPLD